MKIEYDPEVDALYVRLVEEHITETRQFSEGINLDFDDRGRLIGIEILDAKQSYDLAEILKVAM